MVFRSQQHHLSFVSVLVSLLFIPQSPNIGFNNFAAIIVSPVAVKEQQSNKAEITAKAWPQLDLSDYYANHKTA